MYWLHLKTYFRINGQFVLVPHNYKFLLYQVVTNRAETISDYMKIANSASLPKTAVTQLGAI